MQKILEGSVLFRWLTAFFGWIGSKWHESRIVTWFLSPGRYEARYQNSAFAGGGRALHRALCRIFEILRLNRLFKGSIFKQSFIWCLIPAVLAPVLDNTMVILCLVIVGFFSVLVRFGCDRSLRLFASPANKFIVLFAIVYFIATLTSVSVSGSLFTGLLTVVVTLFAIVFDNSVTSRRQADLAIRLFVLVGTAVSLFGIYQYFYYDPGSAGTWIDSDMFSEITNRVYSTLGNPNVLGEYLLLITPFAFACVLTAKTWPKKFLYLLMTGAMLLCMLFTTSRGGWLGLIFAAAIFAVMLDARLLLVGIIGLVALYFVLPDWAIERFASIGNRQDSSTSYRIYIYLGTLAMLKDYWLSGIGPGNAAFNLIYPRYSYNTIAAPHAHNLYLQLTCDAGIVGLLLFMMILFSFYRTTFSAFSKSARAHIKEERPTRIYLIAAVAAVSGYLLQGMTDYSFYNNRVTLFFWVVIALGSVLARRSKMEEGTIWLRS
jgi:O-antigen ligase